MGKRVLLLAKCTGTILCVPCCRKKEVWKTYLIVRYDPDVLARYRKDAVKHLLSSIVEAI